MRPILAFRVVISVSNCVIQTALKVDIAMAVIEILMAINLFCHPGIETSMVCGKVLMMSWKSSRLPLMVDRLMSAIDFVMAFNCSLCLVRS